MKISNLLLVYNIFCGEYQEPFDMLLSQSYRVEEKDYYRTILKNNFPRGIPDPHSDLNKNYLSRKYQDRHNYNKPTKICQKGLEKRIENKRVKEKARIEKARTEQKIKEAFSRKIKNKTYNKRHHSKRGGNFSQW